MNYLARWHLKLYTCQASPPDILIKFFESLQSDDGANHVQVTTATRRKAMSAAGDAMYAVNYEWQLKANHSQFKSYLSQNKSDLGYWKSDHNHIKSYLSQYKSYFA